MVLSQVDEDNRDSKIKAVEMFQTALQFDEYYFPATINLASILNELGILIS